MRLPLVSAALLVFAIDVGGCRSGVATNPLTVNDHRDAASGEVHRVTSAEKAMAEPVIRVSPVRIGKSMSLRFEYASADTSEVPLIVSISVERVGDQSTFCRVANPTSAELKEWRFGETPPGFKREGCSSMHPGEYEIVVVGAGGGGKTRVLIDENGGLTPIPWYGEKSQNR